MLDVAAVRPVAWGIIVFLALFSTCLAFFLHLALRPPLFHDGVAADGRAGVPTALFAYLFLGDPLGVGLLGAVVIVGTVVAATWADGRTGAPAAPAAPVVVFPSSRAAPEIARVEAPRRQDGGLGYSATMTPRRRAKAAA